MNVMRRTSISISIASALMLVGSPAPTLAQVPVNDAARTTTESRTKVCMLRARKFRQATVSPAGGVKTSFTTQNDLSGMGGVSGQSVQGSELTGSTIAESNFGMLLAVVGTISALKTKNVAQAMNSLAAVAAAIEANTSTVSAQTGTIGTANSQQGAMDQNSLARLSAAQIWNQAIQAISTRNAMRNQQLLDQAAAESAGAKFMNGDK